jgi:hypothetical protein
LAKDSHRPGAAVHGVLDQGPLADQKAVVRPMLFIWPVLNIPLEFGRGKLKEVSIFSSGIDPVWALFTEHLEDDGTV